LGNGRQVLALAAAQGDRAANRRVHIREPHPCQRQCINVIVCHLSSSTRGEKGCTASGSRRTSLMHPHLRTRRDQYAQTSVSYSVARPRERRGNGVGPGSRSVGVACAARTQPLNNLSKSIPPSHLKTVVRVSDLMQPPPPSFDRNRSKLPSDLVT